MSKNRCHFCFLSGVTAFLCVAIASPVWAGDPLPGETIPIVGTERTDAVLFPKIPDLTVAFEKNAALKVTGEEAAVNLGPGGKVTLAAGAHLSRTGGDALPEENDINGIAISGGDDADAIGDSCVVMAQGSGIAVDGSDAVGADGSSVSVRGIGIDHAESAEVVMDGAKVAVTEKSADEMSRNVYTHGVLVKDSHQATVTMNNGAQITTDVSVTDDGDKKAYAWGVYSQDIMRDDPNDPNDPSDQVSVACQSGSQIKATVEVNGGTSADTTAGEAGAQAVGVAVFNASKHAEVTVNDARITADATSTRAGQKVLATGVQLANLGSENDVATLRVENGSRVDAIARGSNAYAVGGAMMTMNGGVVHEADIDVTSGSHITATALSDNGSQAEAVAAVLVTDGVKDVNISVTDATITGIMEAMAEEAGEGNANAEIVGEERFGIVPVGIGVSDYDHATLRLTDAEVAVTANAKAWSASGYSSASAGGSDYVTGMLMEAKSSKLMSVSALSKGTIVAEESGTSIALQGSSVEVAVSAEAAGNSRARAAGIQLRNLSGEQKGDEPTLTLDDSSVRASAEAVLSSATKTMASGASAEVVGIRAAGCQGKTTFLLNKAIVDAEATGDTAVAVGIQVDSSVPGSSAYAMDLRNGSRVSAVSHGGTSSNAKAIQVDGDATITLDATSSLSGGWAVDGQAATVNNQGLMEGRLDVDTLNNFATGTLQADLDSAEAFTYVAGKVDQDFYFKAKTAELDDGTTFRLMPGKGVYNASKGQSMDYALLAATGAEPGTWDQDELTLVGSPLLGLSWAGKSSHKLIAHIQFLTPTEAGLSANAIQAFNAAMADMPADFVFGTDPEAWAPKVSGAFLTGMTQTLGASRATIGNRLGGLMGLNSGDEIVSSNGLWYNASFTDADQGMRGGIVGFNADTAGLSLGYDRQVGPLTLGVAVTQGKSEADADDNSAEMDMADTLFSLYGSVDGGKWFGEAVLSAGNGDVESTRRANGKTFTADYDSTSYNALVNVGMKLSAAGWQINPLLALDCSFKDYDGYTETGGKDSGALEVDSQDYTVLNVGGGATLQRSWVKSWGVLTPEISAMLRYDLEGDRIVTTARFVGGNMGFVAHGADPAETSWDLSTALTVASAGESAVSLRLGYDYAGRDDFSAHSVSGKVRFEF